jgi:hypothetical protein
METGMSLDDEFAFDQTNDAFCLLFALAVILTTTAETYCAYVWIMRKKCTTACLRKLSELANTLQKVTSLYLYSHKGYVSKLGPTFSITLCTFTDSIVCLVLDEVFFETPIKILSMYVLIFNNSSTAESKLHEI